MFISTQSGWINTDHIVRVKMYRLVGEQWVVVAEMSNDKEHTIWDGFFSREEAKEFLNNLMCQINGSPYTITLKEKKC